MSKCADCQQTRQCLFAVEHRGRVAQLCEPCLSHYASSEAARSILSRRLQREEASDLAIARAERRLAELDVAEASMRRMVKRMRRFG